MNRLITLVLACILLSVVYAASAQPGQLPKPTAPVPAQSICLPQEAGGLGTQFTTVDHPDAQVVIHTYLCNGQPMWVYGLYKWEPLRARPKKAGTLAYELKKLYSQMGYMREDKTPYDALARQQLELYQLTPYQLKKETRNNRSVV